MDRTDLTCQQALAESPRIGPQHRSTVTIELDDHAHARRHGVPGVHRAPASDRPSGLAHERIELWHRLADGTAVIEAQPRIDRDPASQPDGVAHERRGGDEATSGVGGCLQRALRQHAVAVDKPRASRKHGHRAMLATIDLRADPPFVVPAEPRRPVVGKRGFDRRAHLLHLADLLRAATPDVLGLVDAVGHGRIARGPGRVLREAESSHADVPDRVG